MLLLVDLIRDCVFGGSETCAGARVGMALGNLCGSVSVLNRGSRGRGIRCTLVALLGGSRHGALGGLDALVDSVPGGQVVSDE